MVEMILFYKVCPNEKETLAVFALYQIPISTKSSYPISLRRRGTCFTNLSQDKEVHGEQCLVQCTIFRWCQHHEAGRLNIKELPCPGQAHVVTNSAAITAVDELIR
ncbi:hypothetical protein AVEN_64414-1 [Araneus ventricosus]|uniref:Mos1 transposase HTH domain-containing protein n=1 Tax=Araneus ventricosus TaxID=182803 RepID=A0A4Y2N5M2_ARAVE|nr:hypothetical protein AVEN_64414-1 [Araneus ventricosus]